MSAKIRDVLSELIGSEIDETFFVIHHSIPTSGENIKIGKNVFINYACVFLDIGGITIEDNVLIGPKVNLITTKHPLIHQTERAIISYPHSY